MLLDHQGALLLKKRSKANSILLYNLIQKIFYDITYIEKGSPQPAVERQLKKREMK